MSMALASPPADADAQRVADHVRAGMFAQDRASRSLGMAVDAMGPGHAAVRMAVREDMLNGVGTCHGGFIAALADSAFAFACNSANVMTVASGFGIDFLAPGRLGDLLVATAREVSRTHRTGVYDVEVANQRRECIAVFRGRSFALPGRQTVPGLPSSA